MNLLRACFRLTFLSILLLGLGCTQVGSKERADLILRSGIVWTGGQGKALEQALAVQDGKILLTGSDTDVEPLIGPDTEVIDLDGAFVVPGFNDNHVHFGSAASFLEFNIMKAASQQDLEAKVRDVIQRVPAGEWIVGGLWGAYDQWAEGSAGEESREAFSPKLFDLGELTDSHSFFLRKFDGSQFAVNRAALLAASLDPEQPEIPGATFVRDPEGRLTGLVTGDGVADFFESRIPEVSRERRLAQTRNALRVIAEAGVTNVSDMSDDLQLDLYRELRDRNELTTRIHFRYPLEQWSTLAEQDIEIGSGDPWIRLGGLKGHIDGIMGNSTARFYEPYDHDPTRRGNWRRLMVDAEGNFVEGQFLDYMLGADKANLQLSIHAIGDEANGLLLDYLETLRLENGEKDRRFRLVHTQVVAERDFPRLGELGIIAEVQPFHLSDDMRWMEERIGADRSAGAYAFRSILDSGAKLSFGSDWPGTAAAEYPINPMLGLYAAVTRQTLSRDPEGGWFGEERLTIEEALRAYTFGSAYANFEDEEKGTIEPGKLADLTVLDQNLLDIEPQALLDVKVLHTVVDGKVVYSKTSAANN